jgi:hypothetical protein
MKKFFVLLLVASSCAPVYVPNVRNSPLFSKAGEFQGSVQFGNGLDLQGAVSVTNHIGVMANYSFAERNKNNYDPDDELGYHYHKFLEGGLGYYENQGNWCYEIFAGYGKGEVLVMMSTNGGADKASARRGVPTLLHSARLSG